MSKLTTILHIPSRHLDQFPLLYLLSASAGKAEIKKAVEHLPDEVYRLVKEAVEEDKRATE